MYVSTYAHVYNTDLHIYIFYIDVYVSVLLKKYMGVYINTYFSNI